MAIDRPSLRTRSLSLVAFVSLIAALTSASPVFAEESAPDATSSVVAEPTDSDGDGALDTPNTESAVAGAAVSHEQVEDLSQRTESATVVANPEGTFTSKEFATPVRMKRDGNWVEVDYTLAKRTDGSWAPKASPVDVSIDGGSAKEAARVTFDDGESLAVTWPTDLPEPTVDGGVATYKISDATDLVVSVTSSGVNTRIRLNKKPEVNDPVFTLGLRAEGVDLNQSSTGGLVVSGDDGKTIAKTSTLVAWDAATDDAGDPANVVDLSADLDETSSNGDVTQHTLDLTTPEGFLSDPDISWPVTIDPDISMNKVRDTWVRNGDTASHGAENRLIVGKINPDTTTNPGPTRSYLKFYNGTIEDNPNIDVLTAELGLYQYYGYSCTDRRMYVYPVGVNWNDTITWANKPAIVYGNGATHVDANRGATGCGDGWTTVNLTSMAKAWAAGSVDMQGIRLSAGDEDYSSYERRFCSMNPESGTGCNTAARTPYLSVTYNVAPSTPGAVTVATGANMPPRISATISDPDGGMVTPHVTIKDGTTTVVDVDTPQVASGTPWTYTSIPLYDGTFTVTVKASDGRLSSAPSAPQMFSVVAADQGATRQVNPGQEAGFISDAVALGAPVTVAKLGVWNEEIAQSLPVRLEQAMEDPVEVIEDPATDEFGYDTPANLEPEADVPADTSPAYESPVPDPQPGQADTFNAADRNCSRYASLYAAKIVRKSYNIFGSRLWTVSLSNRWCGSVAHVTSTGTIVVENRIDSWWASTTNVDITNLGSVGWKAGYQDGEDKGYYYWHGSNRGGHMITKRRVLERCYIRIGICDDKPLRFTFYAHQDGTYKYKIIGLGWDEYGAGWSSPS